MQVTLLEFMTKDEMVNTWKVSYNDWSFNHALGHTRALNWLLLSSIKRMSQRIVGAKQNQRWSSRDYKEMEYIHKRCGLWSEEGDHYG